jgi:hypothetical protein
MVSWQLIFWTQTFLGKSISFMLVFLWKFKDAFSEFIMASLPISKSQALKKDCWKWHKLVVLAKNKSFESQNGQSTNIPSHLVMS